MPYGWQFYFRRYRDAPTTYGQEKSITHCHVDNKMMQVFSHSVFNSEYDDKDVA